MTTATRTSLVPLRPYQREAVDAVHAAYSRGVTRQLLSMPTGAGKTIVAAHLIAEVGMPRVVFLVHRDELATQAESALSRINPDLKIGRVQAERDELDADVLVVSAQTIVREPRLDRLVEALDGQQVLFIPDEAHHDVAPLRRRAIERVNPALLVGLTATPERGDSMGLDAVYEEIVYHVDILTLIRQDRLARLIGKRVETDSDLDGVNTRGGEFAEGELSEAVNTTGRNRLIVDVWQREAADRKRTVVFCVDVAHAVAVRDAFRSAGITAEAVMGETPADERKAILEAFHRGDVQVLTNCMVLTEGYDEPAIDCIVMARPTKSRGLYQQCVGRGARKSDQKADCLVLDIADVTKRHTLASFPSLAGLEERSAVAEAMASGGATDLLECVAREVAIREQRTLEIDLFTGSPVVWKNVETLHFVRAGSSAEGEMYVVVPREGNGYRPYLLCNPRGPSAEPTLAPIFDRPVDLELALGLAEDAVPRNALTNRSASWRARPLPPTDKQMDMARRIGVRLSVGMTRAQMSDAIDQELFRRAADRAGLVG